ncbi:hypothetical protein C8J56DRAFT_1058888 [Mycena floridula]|nr:hypothetical protein C8J56DRAFT_1058888 [Mycena floridula]
MFSITVPELLLIRDLVEVAANKLSALQSPFGSPSAPPDTRAHSERLSQWSQVAHSPSSTVLSPTSTVSSPLPVLTESETSPSSVGSIDSVPDLITPPLSSSPIISSDSDSDAVYQEAATQMNRNNLYATCEVPAPNKLPLISEGILTPSVLASAIKAICNYCESKGIEDEDAVKQALSCFKGEDLKAWIKKQRVVLVSLTLEDFFDRIGTRFLPVNWELNIIRERNNI